MYFEPPFESTTGILRVAPLHVRQTTRKNEAKTSGVTSIKMVLLLAQEAVVIDPARVAVGNVQEAWGSFFHSIPPRMYVDNKLQHQLQLLRFRHECLRTGLVAELDQAIHTNGVSRDRILVVACHACQHLSDEILAVACRYGAHVAVASCCQKDQSQGSHWKAVGQRLGVPIDTRDH